SQSRRARPASRTKRRSWALALRGLALRGRRAGTHPALEPQRPALHRPVVRIQDVLPRKLVASAGAGVAPAAPEECPLDPVAGGRPLPTQLAEDLVALFVGPHGASD